ncbi:MAG: serine protease spb1 [Bdellovibrionaceae bacterium]|nr:serine protease spb1 [Pseudobdellovibrionaceae bacterium]
MRFAFSVLAFVWVALGGRAAFGSTCCGGGFAAPALISGDEKAQLTASLAAQEITTDVYADGDWRDRSFRETSETIKIEGAHIFRDRWQVGASLPIIRRSRSGEEASGTGDLSGSVGYEYLPEWDYNPWRPRGLGYLQLTIPTGTSVHDARAPYQLDSRGRGFWGVGAGTLLTKAWRTWDVFTRLEAHRSFAKRFAGATDSGILRPGWGGQFSLGAGYNFAQVRWGASLQWSYEDSVDVISAGAVGDVGNGSGSLERFATAAISGSYLWKDLLSLTVSYADQTLFGHPLNARLGQTVILQVQKRWAR